MGHPRTAVLAASFLSVAGLALVGCKTSESITSLPDAQPDSGWVFSEVQANTFTNSRQERPSVAPTADGGMVVAWASRRQEDGSYGVYAQRLDPVGRKIGGEVHVNQRTAGGQDEPAVAVTDDGEVWIAWSSTHTDGQGKAIMLRRYAMTPFGIEPITNETIANATTVGDQSTPAIAIGGNGDVLLAWTQTLDDRSNIITRAFNTLGEPVSEESTIAATKGAIDRRASLATTPGGFTLVWSRQSDGAASWDVIAHRVNALGAPLGQPIMVGDTDALRIEPSIAADASGATVIAWLEQDASGVAYHAVAQRFDSQLSPVGEEYHPATTSASRHSGVAVAAATDGRFLLIWNEEGEKIDTDGHPVMLADVMAQRFDADGATDGESFTINTPRDRRQAMSIAAVAPRVCWTDRDQLIAAWEGATESDSRGVGVTIANPASIAGATPVEIAAAPTTESFAAAFPEFDPTFVPEPREANVRGAGPDFGFVGIPATGWNPPDPDIAVGPGHVVVVANGGIGWLTKAGDAQFQQNIAGGGGFWGAQGASGFVFDPIALYDIHSDRFVVAATERDDVGQSYIVLAISETSDPNDGWVKFRQNVESVAQGIDFPNLGVDEEAVYVSVGFFGPTTGSHIFAYDKADLIAGTLSGQITQTAGGPIVTAGVYDYSTGNPNYYSVTSFSSGSDQLRLFAVVDPLGGHNLIQTTINLPNSHTSPPGAPQAGTSNLADTIDIRIKHAVYRNGSLWCSHGVNAGGVANARWYEIEMNGWPQSGQQPTLRQTGDINPGPGIFTWFPDISVDDEGNAAISYNRSSSSEFISIERAVRKAGDPLGTFRPAVVSQVSTSPETGDRWGDYSGVHEDPTEPGVFWASLEYRTSSWRTWVAKFSAVNANPANFDLVSPLNNQTLATTTPNFAWTAALDADSYTITIADNQSMSSVVHEQSGIVGTSYIPPDGVLDCASEYFWSVTADNLGGSSVSTPVARSFTASLLGDLSGDGVVDTADLGGMIGAFGSTQAFGDINGDGVVDTADLGILLGAFGSSCN